MSNSRLRKLLMPLLRGYIAGKPRTFARMETARQAIYLIEKPLSLKSKAAKVRQRIEKQSSRASHNQETAKIREAVFLRAGANCERPMCGGDAEQMDHWLGGTGRRRERQSVETCWALCTHCHLDRTHNWPSVAQWNAWFKAHCEALGYGFTPHIIHAEPAKAGGAP